MNKPYYPRQRRSKNWVAANRDIRFPEVRVLSDKGEMVGLMSSLEAQEKAREAEKDLVLVTDKSNPPVVKIIDLAKFKYQLQQKEAKQRKQNRKQDLKEVRFTPFMGDGDFESRLKKVKQFLDKGEKVRLSLQFKGRQITKKEFGYEMFDRVFAATQELATKEIEPKLMGKKLIAQLSPITAK